MWYCKVKTNDVLRCWYWSLQQGWDDTIDAGRCNWEHWFHENSYWSQGKLASPGPWGSLKFDLVAGCLSRDWNRLRNGQATLTAVEADSVSWWMQQFMQESQSKGLFIVMFIEYVVMPSTWKDIYKKKPCQSDQDMNGQTALQWAEQRTDADAEMVETLAAVSRINHAPWLYLECTRQGVPAVSCPNSLLQQLAASCWTCCVWRLFSCSTARRKVFYTCLQKDVEDL